MAPGRSGLPAVRAHGGWDVSSGRGFGIIYHDLGQFVTPKRRQMCIHIHAGGTSEIATCSAKAAWPPAGLILPSTTGQQEQEAGPWGPLPVPLLLPGAFWVDLAPSSILGRSGVYEHTLMLGSASLGILGPASPHRALPCLAAPWCPLQARRVPAPLRPPRPAAGGKAERGAIKGSTWRRLLPSRLAPGPVFGLLKTCLQLVSSR